MLITAAYDSGFCAEVSDVKCLVWSPSVQGISPLPHKLNTSAQEQCETTKIPMLM